MHLKSIIVFAWNGKSEALEHIIFDALPNFDVFVFNYSGNNISPSISSGYNADIYLSIQTEFKGELVSHVCKYVKNMTYQYIGLLDDDQSISVSSLNRLLEVANEYNADLFQPSLNKNSYYSHSFFLQKVGSPPEIVSWVEIMSPFLRKQIFEAGEKYYADNISSYGIDRYVFPYLLRKMNYSTILLIHEIAICHLKPVTDGSKIFSNGLDARQEGELMRKKILQRIREENIPFTRQELKSIYEVYSLRWQKWKYDLKRFFGG